MKYKTFICRSCLGLAMMGSLVVTGCTDLLDVERHGATNTSLFIKPPKRPRKHWRLCMVAWRLMIGTPVRT